jgi:nucleoside phosphorylase
LNTGNRHLDPRKSLRRRLRDLPKPEWNIALLCFRLYRDSQPIIDALQAVPVGHSVLSMVETSVSPRVYQATLKGEDIVIAKGQIWSGPYTAILAEELAAAGVKTIIGQGVAGSIDEEIVIGHHVCGTCALKTDGTSTCYLTDLDPVSAYASLANVLAESSETASIPIKSTTVVTVNAFY